MHVLELEILRDIQEHVKAQSELLLIIAKGVNPEYFKQEKVKG